MKTANEGFSAAALAEAEKVRAACVEAARVGYEDASISGLCGEGALEAAISAMQKLDLAGVLAQPKQD